ncbi:chromate efflux transporter [Fontivita pretiosa]|uniref:chromate efflux transporter n=1 Tax=Fontivita pretiosa TaxID=2989684 RepID=UPI003D167144
MPRKSDGSAKMPEAAEAVVADEHRLLELAGVFTRLGFTAFGGPAAHVALIEDQVVTRRQWLDRQHLLDLVSAINFIPGPNSTELAMHIGQLRAGFRGLLVAGACFIAPAMLIILPIAWAYVRFGSLPQVQPALRAIGAAVVAIIAFATWRFARTAIKDVFTTTLAMLVIAAALVFQRYIDLQPEIPCLFLAAIAGAIWYRMRRSRARARTTMLAIAIPATYWPDLARMALTLLKIGGTLFGSGYVLVSYLQSDFVDRLGWLTQRQLVDAIAVGQFTPGPLLTSATFVGYLLGHTKFEAGLTGGVIGGVVATVAIFLPSFILVAIFGPLLQQIRGKAWARGALDGMNAAVVGLMLIVAIRLGIGAVVLPHTHRVDALSLVILIASLIGLWRKLNATWLIIGAAIIGAAQYIWTH